MWLKQSTAATIVLGPFVDSGDGVTPETGLTISQADIRLSKNGGAFAQTNNAAGATHMENGNYSVPLDTTDTGTLGRLRVAVYESGALPTWQDFMILPANVYDSIVAGSDNLQVDTTQWAGASTATDDVALAAAPSNFAALAITAGGAVTAGTVSDKTGYSLAAGAITAAVIATDAIDADAIATGAIDADALSADAGTELGVAVWASATRTLTSGGGGATAQEIWEYGTRTLTSFSTLAADIAASINALLSQIIPQDIPPLSSDIELRRGDNWARAITVGSVSGYVSLDWIIKHDTNELDNRAHWWTRKNASGLNDGLLYLNGEVASTPAQGSITVSDASTGALVLNAYSVATAQLAPGDYSYEVQVIYVAGQSATTVASGKFTILADVVRATS